jgi:hypothetical protein
MPKITQTLELIQAFGKSYPSSTGMLAPGPSGVMTGSGALGQICLATTSVNVRGSCPCGLQNRLWESTPLAFGGITLKRRGGG